MTNILGEVLTNSNGMVCMFLVLVCLGIGCTIWYEFAPGSADHAPASDIFSSVDSYDPFFKFKWILISLTFVGFVLLKETTLLNRAFVNEHPFDEIEIPAIGFRP